MKKLIASILVLALLVSTFACSYASAAAPSKETESNNTIETANSITVNADISGKLSDKNDIDYYKFTITKPAKIQIQDYKVADDRYWSIDIYYSDKNSVISESLGKITTVGETRRIPAGTYYVKITNYASWSYSDKDYMFNILATYEGSTYEKETNDTYSNATSILVNTKIAGNLNNNNDVDYYKFTISKPAKIQIQDYKVADDRYWGIEICYSNKNSVITESLGRITTVGDTRRIPAGTYYVKISNYSSWSYSNKDYNFKILATYEGSTYEKEYNGSKAKAYTISTKKKITGNLNDKNDVDYYKFKVYSKSYLKTYVYGGHGENDCEINIVNSSGKSILYGSFGNISGYLNKVSLSAGTYYVKVTRYAYYFTNKDYSFKIYTVSAPKSVSVKKRTTTTAKLTWKKSIDAKKYQIYYAVGKGKFKKLKTVSSKSSSYIKSSLKKGKTYYFKVRAIDSKGYSSPFSSTVKYKRKK